MDARLTWQVASSLAGAASVFRLLLGKLRDIVGKRDRLQIPHHRKVKITRMLAQLRKAFICLSITFILSTAAFAQMTTMEGDVKDQNGQPLKGAVIDLLRTDIKGHYSTKSDKKGHWFYMGLPFGTYTISCIVDGKVVDKVNNVKSDYGKNTVTDFDMRKTAAAQQSMQAAAQTGQLSQEQEKGMTKEQKEQFEAAAKKASETMKKNKALNDAFNGGIDNIKKAQADTDATAKATDYKAAIDSLNNAATIDPNQVAIYENLGSAYYGLGMSQTGDDRIKSLDLALADYQKSAQMRPTEAGYYIQMGNIYAAEKKMPEAEQALTKAVQLDPSTAGKAYYNLGANLVNTGHSDQASEFFQKSVDANPNNPEAWYQLGLSLAAKGSVDTKTGATTYPPGTAEAYQKYLQLQPTGPHAEESKAMLEAINQTVQTKVTVPQKKK